MLETNIFLENNIFQERAEKLEKDDIFNWMSLTEKDNQIIKKLVNNSTKLLIGPRGAGKSMLMKWAYYTSLKESEILPIYVNFEKYLHIEPLLYNASNGNSIFVNWVLAKLVIETKTSLLECNKYDAAQFEGLVLKHFETSTSDLKRLVYTLEGGVLGREKFKEIGQIELSVGNVLEFIGELIKLTNRQRAVLLLDDAAHAFSSELQKEFFELFRILKSKEVTAKAAVYPGLTTYSPYFNIGHDALFLEAGYSPSQNRYVEFCDELLRKRLGAEKYSILNKKREGLLMLYYAANGIPRALIVMSEYLLNDEQSKTSINNTKYYEAVNEWISTVEHFHSSLKSRLPRYQNFINTGIELLNIILEEIKQLNRNKEPDRKFVYFALSTPMPTELEKVLQILEYAGLVTQDKDISKGTKGVFKRYMIHLGKIIQSNTLAQGKTKTFDYISECLQKIKTRQFKRFNSTSLFTEEMIEKCKFELPPCSDCGKQRIFEEAKFCAYCGSELKSASLFLELIEQDISALPLTSKRVQMIKSGSNIITIKDILMDDNGVELKKVKGIQGYWAQKIKDYAEEFIGG
ncbi:ORC-CDC6 family AAA ATPase [Priestia megaterium]|uniref:ORC-CDC6 family AAA ATPase n=1 Tax=Priestia megaterium TaxID=1404 RepID=UPI000BFBE86A|nr:zinc ribbon domain-containing protein [Priestia megaterium]PGT77449.1 hypothetical protein COD15_01625 [Priestia megaterium]